MTNTNLRIALWLSAMIETLITIAKFARKCFRCTARYLGFTLIPRKHKRILHTGMLSVIAWEFFHVGAQLSDLLFLLLAFLIEVEETAHDSDDHGLIQKHAIDISDLSSVTLTIPDTDKWIGRMQHAITLMGAELLAWDDPRTREVFAGGSPDTNGITWGGRGALKGKTFVSVRPTFTPFITLYLLSHELGHVMSQVRADVTAADKLGDLVGTCWLREDDILKSLMVGNPMYAISRAGEREAEHINLAVFERMGWPRDTQLAYLENWEGETLDPCLGAHVEAVADQIARILRGGAR